jgi:hypothetical protein
VTQSGAPRGSVTRAAVVLAADVLLSTLAAVRLGDSGWAVLAAPAAMAVTGRSKGSCRDISYRRVSCRRRMGGHARTSRVGRGDVTGGTNR